MPEPPPRAIHQRTYQACFPRPHNRGNDDGHPRAVGRTCLVPASYGRTATDRQHRTTKRAAATRTATQSGDNLLGMAQRVNPWAGATLSRLSTQGEVMNRYWGGEAGQVGAWLTPILPTSSAVARVGLALPAENAALYISRVVLPAGTRMQVCTAGRAFGHAGGWPQTQLLESIPLSSFGKVVPIY